MFELTDKPIVPLASSDPTAGAQVVFTGIVRNHNDGRDVLKLEYEAMLSVADKEGEKICEEAALRFEASRVHCVHRVGALQIGDVAVQVTVTSRHRKAAFGACEYVIDEIKKRVPIWKREHYADGTVEWVNAAQQAVHEGPAVLVGSAESLAEWTLIDVRDADEVLEDPIHPFAHLTSSVVHFDRRLLSQGRTLLVCATGIRALILADDLRREGYADVWSLTGGCKTLKQIARKCGPPTA